MAIVTGIKETTVNDNGTAGTITFIVYDDAASPSALTAGDVINQLGVGVMPSHGFPHPDPQFSNLRALDWSNVHPDENTQSAWYITWSYVGPAVIVGGGNGPGTVGYWEYEYRATKEFVDAWREESPPNSAFNVAPFSDGIPLFDGSGFPLDVGGRPIDSCGEPASTLILQQYLEITEHYDPDETPAAPTFFIGTRNDAVFLGSQKGRLAYHGITKSGRLDNGLASATHTLIWDAWLHMRQRVARGMNGEPFTRPYAGTSLGAPRVATWVYWHQPFGRLTNFQQISPYWP